MTQVALIRWALAQTDAWMLGAVEDMRDALLTQPTARGGNHPLWVIGHIAVVEGTFAHFLFGQPNPVGSWDPLFARGTEPTTDASAYPPFDEILATYRSLRAKSLARLDEIDDAWLDQPSDSLPPGFSDPSLSRGQILLILALHQANHLGQIADARRASGKSPRF